MSLMNLGLMVGLQGDHTRASEPLEESLVLGRACGNLGTFAVEEGDLARAWITLHESRALHRDLGDTAGAVEGIRGASGAARPRYPRPRRAHGRQCAGGFSMEAFDTAWAEGAALSIEQVIAATLASV